jgi:hypothetical protein
VFYVLLYRFDCVCVCVVICLALFVFVYCTTVTYFISGCLMTGFGSMKYIYVCAYMCFCVRAHVCVCVHMYVCI